MNKICLRKGILVAGIVMALSPAVLLAEDLMNPPANVPAEMPAVEAPAVPETTVKTPAEIRKEKQQQKRKAQQANKQQQAAQPTPVKEIQDIPDPKNLGSD